VIARAGVDWWLEPDTKPDVYRVAFPKRTNTVTYVTDVDSITFTIAPGETRDLIVMLNGSTACQNQLSSVPAYARPRVLSGDSMATQVIPFTLRQNRIYVQGRINGSGNCGDSALSPIRIVTDTHSVHCHRSPQAADSLRATVPAAWPRVSDVTFRRRSRAFQ
jgi:hypothetical protein